MIILQKRLNPNWPEIPDHPYWILKVGGSGSGKTNSLLNLINLEPDIDKLYSYAKDSCKAKYHLLINKWESTGLKYLKWFQSVYWVISWNRWYL